MSRRPTAVEGDIFWFICCLLVFVTGLPTLSTATRLTTKFETAQVSIGSSSQPKSQVSFQTISKGNRSGVRDFQQRIVRNQNEWEGLWRQHTATEANPSTPPAVDFNKEIVIAVFLGEKPTGGHTVELIQIDRNNGELEILFKEAAPPPGGIATQALTQPFHMVRVAMNGNPKVSFRRYS
jgi:hypothetical protein